jgi:VanZ family protein
MVLIFWLSSRPENDIPSLFWGQDKLEHFLAFGMLGFFYYYSFRQREANPSFTRVLLITLMVAAYGLFDESHQYFVPGRDASLADLAADTAGGFIAAVIFCNKRF